MTTAADPLVAIVVPTFNTAELLHGCLESLLDSVRHRDDVQVIVSDDGSTDGTAAMLGRFSDRLTVVRSPENHGFATACNSGAAAARARWLLFYNTDLVPGEGWLDRLLDYAGSVPGPAVVGTKLLFPDGRIQHAGVVLCADGYPRHVYAGFPADHPVVNRSGPARIVTGACMLVARTWFARLSGFDMVYRNGYEDVDLCLRAGAAGGTVHYCHQSELTHLVSATREHRRAEFAASELRFLQRWGHLPADDLARYLEDGLLTVEYSHTYPFRLRVASQLAVASNQDGALDGDDPYRALAAQLHAARRENVQLKLQLAARQGTDTPLTDAPPGTARA